jgi:hypothetical protein
MCKMIAILLSLMSVGLMLGGCTGERLKSTSSGAQGIIYLTMSDQAF